MAQRKYTEAVKTSNRKWDAANLDRLSLALPAGSRDKIKAHAQAMGESVNGFIGRAVLETIERDKEAAVTASIAEEQGVTVADVIAAEEFARVLDHHPDIKKFLLSKQGDTPTPGGYDQGDTPAG